MKRLVAIIDTNVVVAGVLTQDPSSPTARIVDGMLRGAVTFVVSIELLGEYRSVLLRARSRKLHGLSDDEVDTILTEIAANAIVRQAPAMENPGPDPGDRHLWDLLAATPRGVLVTGDRLLVDQAPRGASVASPATFISVPDDKAATAGDGTIQRRRPADASE